MVEASLVVGGEGLVDGGGRQMTEAGEGSWRGLTEPALLGPGLYAVRGPKPELQRTGRALGLT